MRLAKRRWMCRIRVSTCRMKADSLEPPGRRGEARGWGRVEGEVVEALVDEGAGERRKPPAPAGGGEEGMVWLCITVDTCEDQNYRGSETGI